MIAVKILANNDSIEVWDIWDETNVIITLNEGKQYSRQLYETSEGTYFNFLGSRHYLGDFNRTDGGYSNDCY